MDLMSYMSIITIKMLSVDYIMIDAKPQKAVPFYNNKINKPMLRAYHKFAVNTESKICSDVGLNILKSGGNAVDAAVASVLCIGVVNSFSSGLGGGAYMLLKKNDMVQMLDFTVKAPENIDPEYFKHNPDKSKKGASAACTPGELLGLYEAHKEHGRLPWKDVIGEVVKVAVGFPAPKILEIKLKELEKFVFADPGLRNIFTRNGKLLKEGDMVYQPNLANTLREIAQDPMSFYTGSLAKRIAATIKNNGGFITESDLRNYEVKKRPVVMGRYKDYKVYTTNLPTTGPLIIQCLNILDKLNLEKMKLEGENAFYVYHMLIEIFKFMFSERGELSDPDFLDNWMSLVSHLTTDKASSKAYQSINLNSAMEREHFAKVKPFTNDHGTSHLNVVDGEGMIVQVTASINLGFGCKFLDPDTGIIFNNAMDDFYIPGVVSEYQLDEMMPNVLKGGKRPVSSMSPVILERENETIAIGAAGGTMIPTSIIGVLVSVFLGNSLEEAIDSTRLHDQLVPNVTLVEENFPKAIKSKLEMLGHNIQSSNQATTFTSVQGIRIRKDSVGNKSIEAISDKRKHGQSSGV